MSPATSVQSSIPVFKIWLMACRPKTLPAAISPVILGTALAIGDGGYHIPSAILALIGAMAIQIGTNLANDYYDFQKGTDTSERIGPVRVTQAGLLKPQTVRLGFMFAFGVAAIIAALLTLRGGWPLMLIGAVSIICGILYTAGPRPLGYMGLGELFVFIFFGPIAVTATYFIQVREIYPAVILSGFAPGFLASAILIVNNLRDIPTDKKANKKTLAVRWGAHFAQNAYFLFIAMAALMPMVVYRVVNDHIEIFLSSLILLFALPSIRTVFTKEDGPSLNHALAQTSLLTFLYCLLYSFGWIYADLRF